MTDPTASVPSFSVRATLANGVTISIREIDAADKAGLLAAFEALSPESRYTRFFSPMPQLSDTLLEAATHPNPHTAAALVAVAEGAGTIVGGARYGAAAGSDTCEFAVTVADDWHRLGLANRLMAVLIEMARARGFRTMEGYVLATNAGMRRLARRLGFTDAACPGDATTRIVTLVLRPDTAAGAAPGGAGDGAGEDAADKAGP